MAYPRAMRKRIAGARKRVKRARRSPKVVSGVKRRKKASPNPLMKKKAITKLVKRVIDKENPDTIITTNFVYTKGPVINAFDQGYLYSPVAPVGGDDNKIAGLSLPRRLAALHGFADNSVAATTVGNGVKCRGLRYHGYFTLSPNVFASLTAGETVASMCRVDCFILSDKYNPLRSNRDPNCVNDLLVERDIVWPNIGNGYVGAGVENMLVNYQGNVNTYALPINRERFKVHHHKSWYISPKSMAQATSLPAGGSPNIMAPGPLTRSFSFKIKTPKILKWDRRVTDQAVNDNNVQVPDNVGDPFVVWGYSTQPNITNLRIAQGLLIDQYLTIRVEPEISAAK